MEADELRRLIDTRRDLHRHPELAYQERRTAGIVAERLAAAGYAVETGVAETGVVGTLEGGGGDGPTVLLRADMDALAIDEDTTHDFASTVPGVMHACGHDGHVAVGLAVAERLAGSRNEWAGTVRCVFQPAEEGKGGARRMVEAGVHEGAALALGLHLWLGLPSGVVGITAGPFMAGALVFRIVIHGRGGHGAIPHEAIDPIVAGSQVVSALQTIVSRELSPAEPAVISVGTFRAGDAANVIPERAVLEGTARAFDETTLRHLRRRIEEVAVRVSGAMGASAEVTFPQAEVPTVNDPAITDMVRETAEAVVGPDRMVVGSAARTMASEDFGAFLKHLPGCYFFVGARNREMGAVHPHHSPHFDICEEALPVAVAVLERAARRFLRAGAPRGSA